jgi:DNA-binding PadR family transcriptional regulator
MSDYVLEVPASDPAPTRRHELTRQAYLAGYAEKRERRVYTILLLLEDSPKDTNALSEVLGITHNALANTLKRKDVRRCVHYKGRPTYDYELTDVGRKELKRLEKKYEDHEVDKVEEHGHDHEVERGHDEEVPQELEYHVPPDDEKRLKRLLAVLNNRPTGVELGNMPHMAGMQLTTIKHFLGLLEASDFVRGEDGKRGKLYMITAEGRSELSRLRRKNGYGRLSPFTRPTNKPYEQMGEVERDGRVLEYLLLRKLTGGPRLRDTLIEQTAATCNMPQERVRHFVELMQGENLIERYNDNRIIASRAGEVKYKALTEQMATAEKMVVGR